MTLVFLFTFAIGNVWAADPTVSFEYTSSTLSNYHKTYTTEGITISSSISSVSQNGTHYYAAGISSAMDASASSLSNCLDITTTGVTIDSVAFLISRNSSSKAVSPVLVGYDVNAFTTLKPSTAPVYIVQQSCSSSNTNYADAVWMKFDTHNDGLKKVRLVKQFKKVNCTIGTNTYVSGTTYFDGAQTFRLWGVKVWLHPAAKTDPTITFNNGAYTVGGALDLSTLFASNSDGAVTYTVKTDGGTNASIVGTSFSASAAGTAVVTASQAATSAFNAATKDANIVVSVPSTPTHSISYTNLKGSDVSAYPTTYYEGTGIASFAALADVADFHFTGWDPASISDTEDQDVEVEAQWVDAYNVSFSAGAGSGTVPTTFQKWDGATFNLPDQGSMVAPSGKAFDGWKANGTGDKLAAGAEYTMGAAAVQFVAQWKPVIKLVKDDGSLNTTDFSAIDASLVTEDVTVEGKNYSKTVKVGGAASGIPNVDAFKKVISYETTTDATHVKISLYDVYSSSTTHKAYVMIVKEGEVTPIVNETISITISTKRDCVKEYDLTGHSNLYICVEKQDIRVCQIEVNENGTALEKKEAPAVGYSINLNKGRLLAPVKQTNTAYEGLTYNLAEKYLPGSSADARIKNLNSEFISFVVPTGQTRQLQLTTSNTNNYTVSKTKGDDQNQFTPTANTAKSWNLTAGTWYINPQGSNVQITNIAFATAPAAHTISFDSDGGSDVASIPVFDGDKATAPADPTKEHCRFDGWYNGATPYDWTANVTGDLTLTAHWTQLYTISFAAGEGSGDAPATVADKAQGETFTVPANTYDAPVDKVFAGWNDGTNDYAPGDTYTVGTANVVLTAQWINANFVARIGSTYYSAFADAIAVVADGQTIELLQNCESTTAWTIAGKTVTLDMNGKNLTGPATGDVIDINADGKLILTDNAATDDPTINGSNEVTYAGGKLTGKWPINVNAGGEFVMNGGWIVAGEAAAWVGYTGKVTINNGVLEARDNAVVMAPGNNGQGGYTIDINGGILLGHITSAGYASACVYHPNTGVLNISGGTLVSTNGPAVVVRAGESHITGGTIISQGGGGKVGDASAAVPAVGVVYDFKANYPGADINAAITAGNITSVAAIYAGTTPTTAEEDAVAISGGTFNSPVAQALCAENYAPNSWTDGTGTHYGVKPLAVNFDIEAYVVGDNTVDLDDVKEQLTAKGYAYSNISGVDRGHTHNYIYDGIKWSNANDGYIQFETAAKKLVIVKTGRMQSDASAKMSVNGVESATVIESADESKETHKLYYWYNADAALYKLDIKSKTAGGTCVLKAITITDPYEVSFDVNGGDPIASQYFYGTAITLPTPTYGTYSFKGWYDAETGGNLIGAAGASYTPTGNIELHAQWETVSTVNTLSDLQVDGATIDGFDPATNIYYLVYEYGQQPVITSATATSSVAEVTINNTPVDEGTYKYVQVKVVPESGEEDQKFYQVRYTNKLKRGVEIIKATVSGGDQSTGFEATGYYGGTGYAKLADNKKMNTNNYVGVKLAAGKTFSTGDVLFVATVSPSTSGGSQIEIYAESAGTNLIWNTGEIDLTNGIALPAEFDGLDEFYIVRKASEGSQAWNGFVNYVSVERYMAPFIEEFKIGEAIGTIDKVNKTIAVEVPATADLEHLTPTIKAYANGGETLDKTGEQDFSAGAVNYTVSSAYAEDGDVTYAVTVTKAAAIKEVIISGTLSVLEGETTTLSAAVYDTNDELASIQAVVWTVKSGDESLAEVSATGVVTAKAVGTAHIIATSVADDTKSAQVEVTVSENPCRVWNAPATSWSDAIVTIGKFQIKRGDCPASSSVTPYSGASSVYGIKVDGNVKFIELTMSDGSQFESLTLGVTSGSNSSSPKYALVASSAVTFNTSSVLSVAEYAANAKDAAQALNDIDLPTGTRNVRIYRTYEGKGDGTSIYLYYANACKKELVPLTSISVADMSLAVGVAGTPVVTLNPTTADVASYVWNIESDETGDATIDPATGVLSSTAAGAVTVKVTATDAFSNVRESNVATINIVNKYVDVVPVSETTTWSWSGKATTDVIITGVDTVLANYFSGAEWQKIAGKAANDQYAYRSSSYDCYQGTYLYLNATVPGMLVINTRYASSGAKLSVNGHEIAPLTDQYTEYKVAVPAGNVKIEATGNQKMRIKTMKFDTDFSKYAVTNNRFNGYTRDVTEGRYGTICLPNGGIMVGAELYEVAYYDGTYEKIFLDEVLNGKMVAGRPYIFLTKEGVNQIAVYYTDEENAPEGDYHGLFGSYSKIHLAPNDHIYILKDNRYYFVDTDNVFCGANRAYFKMGVAGGISGSYVVPAPGRRRMSIGAGAPKLPTGIENTGFESEAPRKVLINGELYIIRGEKMYDAKGQLVK